MSSNDLVELGRITLLVRRSATRWRQAIASPQPQLPPVEVVEFGEGAEWEDASGAWVEYCGVGEGGAILVRPEQHVAWHQVNAPERCDAALGEASAAVLDPRVDVEAQRRTPSLSLNYL